MDRRSYLFFAQMFAILGIICNRKNDNPKNELPGLKDILERISNITLLNHSIYLNYRVVILPYFVQMVF